MKVNEGVEPELLKVNEWVGKRKKKAGWISQAGVALLQHITIRIADNFLCGFRREKSYFKVYEKRGKNTKFSFMIEERKKERKKDDWVF